MTKYHIDGRAGCKYEVKCCHNVSEATITWYNIGGGLPLKNSSNILITVSSLSQTYNCTKLSMYVQTVINSVNLCCTLSSPCRTVHRESFGYSQSECYNLLIQAAFIFTG